MTNPNKEVFKYNGQYTAAYYNQFFNPNLCHVCKSINRGNLILCDRCCLISYCSEEHKQIHHLYHVKICTIIVQVVQVSPCKDRLRYSNWQQWIQARKNLMELIQQRFDGPMEPYMQQMILWSKSCTVCHQQTELRVCERCFSANYCNEHADVFNKKHDGGKCDRFMLLLNIDIETISGNTTDMHYDFLPSINKQKHFEEMLEFCMEYLLMPRKDMDWLAKDYVQSDYLSGPLTVYSVLSRIYLLGILRDKNVVIQIIAASSVETNNLPAWEILLHLIPEIQTLSIILIRPESNDVYKKEDIELCELCKTKKNKLLFLSFSMLYQDFILSVMPVIPNIIVGFHVEFSKGNIWSGSIEAIQTRSCPLLLSFSCEQKVENNIIEIQNALGFAKIPIFNKRNHFAGLAPHRDLETGDTYFRNERVIFYGDLYYYNDTNSCNSYSLSLNNL